MPPQDQQPAPAPVTPAPAPAPTQPTTPPAATPALDAGSKKIKNAGTSVLALGVLMVVLGGISLLGVKSLPADRQTMSYGYLGLVVLISLYWVVQGMAIKKAADNATAAAKIMPVLVTAVAIVVLTVVGMLVKPGGGGALAGILALVLAIYLFVARNGLKKA